MSEGHIGNYLRRVTKIKNKELIKSYNSLTISISPSTSSYITHAHLIQTFQTLPL